MPTTSRFTRATVTACLCSIFATCALAEGTMATNPALEQQINEAEWSLRNSSVASKISRSVLDSSIKLLDAARLEIAAGRPAKADQLLSQAARPLYEMSPEALAGKHPDQRQWLAERRETLAAIADGSEKIAAQQGSSTEFAKMARSAIQRSLLLEQQGQPDKALAILTDAYVAVQHQVAHQRNGVTLYLPIVAGSTDQQWADGLRRYEERKQITEYLISEARAEGLDPTPLQSGLLAAERSWQEAAGMAESRRWAQAMRSLDIAYLQIEDSWRVVGIDW